MRARALLVVAALAGCKGSPPRDQQGAASGSAVPAGSAGSAFAVDPHAGLDLGKGSAAPVPPGDWETCKAALTAVPKLPVTKQVAALLDGCRPCGDWKPLLTWLAPADKGGPTREAVEAAMIGCKAYCDPNAKMRFQGALDEARGKDESRTPWRLLGEYCKEAVSAAPDPRFMSAPYFALDRIARYAATQPDGDKLLGAISLTLPAVSVSGAGLDLPTSAVTRPIAGKAAVTITAAELRLATLPVGKLGAAGVTVTGDLYPGDVVALAALPAALDKLAAPVLAFTPRLLPAARLAQVLAALGKRTVLLAVKATPNPTGWTMYGASPIELTGAATPAPGAKTFTVTVDAVADDAIKTVAAQPAETWAGNTPPTIELGPKATMESLAAVLGALAYKDVKRVRVIVGKARP